MRVWPGRNSPGDRSRRGFVDRAVPSLRGARALAFAPGGGELDVAAPGADAVVPLRRGATGGLTAPPSLSPAAAPILNGVGALAPFGRQLYGASAVDDGVVVLER